MRRAPARRVRVCFVRSCCSVVDQEHDLRTTLAQCNAKQALSSHFTLHSSHFTLALHLNSSHLGSSHLIPCLAQNTFQYYFVLQSLHEVFPSTTLYHKACTKHFPVLMPITKACRKLLPSITLYYKACTKYFLPVLLCTTKLAQNTSQYYFVLQSLQSTSQYYFVLQSWSQYYFVLQSLHKARSSTTL